MWVGVLSFGGLHLVGRIKAECVCLCVCVHALVNDREGGGDFKQLFHHAGKQSEHIQNQAPTNPVVGPSGPLFASYSRRSTTLIQKNSGRGRFPPKAALVLLFSWATFLIW